VSGVVVASLMDVSLLLSLIIKGGTAFYADTIFVTRLLI
jgi:hypothetical protein